MPRTIVVLHGGLGNQLFQLFIGEALARTTRSELALYDGVLHRYAVPHVVEVGPLVPDLDRRLRLTLVERRLARARLPKALARLRGKEAILRLGPLKLVDGYFQQDPARWGIPALVGCAILEEWRARLRLPPPRAGTTLHHVRLRDFFRTPQEAEAHAERRVRAAGPGVFMSDDDGLLGRVLGRHGRHADLVPSAGGSAWEALRMMAGFDTIETNGSTLAVWAALLAGGRIRTTVVGHAAFARALGAAAEPATAIRT
ncbi:MAG: hypothetical protein NZM40_08780 [Sphingomonadaceae bacterium]|uniref:hypothetical protein n=1 Tax=Thermaurantiacus sp. TaxID=2820283 RepID=UPI00298EFC73|nr:hypothetical protein [Thermaurantiacus sp.]MCS6987503.1 hypothetical protein [Sphingomonadaceae bacterium]MDW8415104.1 hypothetical protein [Thermaurantiacus sp.]